MTAKWVSCIFLIAGLVLATGCRTPIPNLKPDKVPDQLVGPPTDQARYDQTGYPKQAFDVPEDPSKALDGKGVATPGRSAGGGGMGGLPGR